MMGLSLDIKSAHKWIVLRESEWGLVGFSLDGKLHQTIQYPAPESSWNGILSNKI